MYLSRKDIEAIGETVLTDFAMKHTEDMRYPFLGLS